MNIGKFPLLDLWVNYKFKVHQRYSDINYGGNGPDLPEIYLPPVYTNFILFASLQLQLAHFW